MLTILVPRPRYSMRLLHTFGTALASTSVPCLLPQPLSQQRPSVPANGLQGYFLSCSNCIDKFPESVLLAYDYCPESETKVGPSCCTVTSQVLQFARCSRFLGKQDLWLKLHALYSLSYQSSKTLHVASRNCR